MKHDTFLKTYAIPLSLIAVGSFVLGSLCQIILTKGDFWSGALAASALILLVGVSLYIAWRIAQGGPGLARIMFLAFLLRVFLAVFLAWGLPQFGYGEVIQQEGFVFNDAYRRDTSAWELARSGKPLGSAFSDSYAGDQYGGMLALSALVYRYLSPDTHRPILISILAAGAIPLSLPFLLGVLKSRLSVKAAYWAGLILAFYLEGILLGATQMREPFIILFSTILFWSAVRWLDHDRVKQVIPFFLVGIGGLILFSVTMALLIIAALFVWIWVVESPKMQRKSLKILGWGLIIISLLVAAILLKDWMKAVLNWDAYLTVVHSGQMQFQLEKIPKWLGFPFIVVYGLFQPVLPAAITDPAPWIWRSLGVFRAIGWYAILPILVYAFIRVWRLKPVSLRQWLIPLICLVWVWLIIASARAGGDQWDNPRYRTIFLPWMALISGWCISFTREIKDRWLSRILLVEGIFLIVFTEWYLSRHYPAFPHLDFWVMIAIILILGGAVMLGGWILDRRRNKLTLTDDGESL